MKFRTLTVDEMEFVTGGNCGFGYECRWGPGADESLENLREGYTIDAEEERAAAEAEQEEEEDTAPPPIADPVDPAPPAQPANPGFDPEGADGGNLF